MWSCTASFPDSLPEEALVRGAEIAHREFVRPGYSVRWYGPKNQSTLVYRRRVGTSRLAVSLP